jgi:endonuclease-3
LTLQKQDIQEIFRILHHTWPHAKCELEYKTPFQLLIAVMLSAQTSDKAVNKAFGSYLKENPKFSPNDLIALGVTEFLSVIQSIGLAPTKAKNCYKTTEILIEKYAGNVPLNRVDLESLPGVGRKTANVILNILCQQPTIAVDTHVHRVSQRIGLVDQNTSSRLKIEMELLKIVPKEYLLTAHHLLIFHGRYHCIARKPKCHLCKIHHLCLYIK